MCRKDDAELVGSETTVASDKRKLIRVIVLLGLTFRPRIHFGTIK